MVLLIEYASRPRTGIAKVGAPFDRPSSKSPRVPAFHTVRCTTYNRNLVIDEGKLQLD